MAEPIYITVGFKCADNAAFDALWQDIRTRYKFMADEKGAPTQAFAVSKGNMFAEQDAVEALLDANLDPDALSEALRQLPCCPDLPALLAEYGVDNGHD
jgi:hypothetical protein